MLDDYARGWVRVERDWAGGSVLWHNGSNTLWYALLLLLPATNTVLAFATNDGAIRAAETAFVELAKELGGVGGRVEGMADLRKRTVSNALTTKRSFLGS